MKLALIVSLIMMTACSSNKIQDTVPPFQKEKVCSVEAINYLKSYKPAPAAKKAYTPDEIHPLMLGLEPSIRNCYEEEMVRTNKHESFNLCFVVGYSPKGKMEFFEFSTNEVVLTTELKACLTKIKDRKELKGFKNLSIVQPYRLYPKPY